MPNNKLGIAAILVGPNHTLLVAEQLPIVHREDEAGNKLLQFDIIALLAKLFTPLVVAVTSVAHFVSEAFAVLQRPIVSNVPTASPLKALRTPNLLERLSEKQIDRMRARLSSEDAIREDNAAALKTIDKHFGIERSAKTEYQDFRAVRPH